MDTQTKNKELRVIEERIKLGIPYDDPKLFFAYPAYGPNTYAQVGELITKANLIKPTMADTVDLVHAAFHSDDKYSKEIREIMKNYWLWAFTGNHYIPGKGVYIAPDPEIRNGRPFMEESELVKRLEAHDPSVRFVPFGFKTGEMTPNELSRNPYILALVGEERAEKLVEIASKHKNKPYLLGVTSVDRPSTRVSALYSGWLVHRLCGGGNRPGARADGCGLGV